MSGVTAREASIFACLVDTAVSPGPTLPAVAQTDAVAFFGRYLRRCPQPNRLGLRAALVALDLGPRLLGYGASLRDLAPEQRLAYLIRLESGRLEQPVKALRSVAQLSYYGDDGVMAILGYDAEGRVRRGRDLRRAEGRW